MHATVVDSAPGEQIDVDDLTMDRAWAWGRALAGVHRDAAGIDAGLPEAFGELAEVPRLFPDDSALAKATARLGGWLADLPRDHSRFGVVHGDFELDNLAWEGERATAFDFDEAAVSWYAADVAYALRDLTDSAGHPAAGRRGLFAAFIAGCRSVRPLDDADLAHTRSFAGVHAVCSLLHISRALGTPAGDEPGWMAELRADLIDMARSHRALAVAIGEAL